MKIGIVSNLYPPNINGGAEVIAHELANSLSKAGNNVFVITLGKSDYLRTEGDIRIYEVGYRNGNFVNAIDTYSKLFRYLMRIIDLQNPFLYFAFKKILKKENPDLIHCHNIEGISTSIWKCSYKLKIPVVQHFHDHFFVCRHGTLFLKGKICTRPKKICFLRMAFFKKMLINYVNWIIAPSNSCFQNNMHYLFGAEDTKPHSIVINGTSLTSEPVTHRNFEENSTLKVCLIGALTKHKGIEVFIDCIKEAKKKHFNISFSIAGRGPFESSIITLSKEFTDVKYLGFINKEQKISLLQQSHLMIFTSMCSENNPVVLLEAYAMGLPVIASRVGGVPEIIPEDWCFPVGDSVQLSVKLTQVYYDRKLLESESKRILKNRDSISIERQCSETVSAYKSLLKMNNH